MWKFLSISKNDGNVLDVAACFIARVAFFKSIQFCGLRKCNQHEQFSISIVTRICCSFLRHFQFDTKTYKIKVKCPAAHSVSFKAVRLSVNAWEVFYHQTHPSTQRMNRGNNGFTGPLNPAFLFCCRQICGD